MTELQQGQIPQANPLKKYFPILKLVIVWFITVKQYMEAIKMFLNQIGLESQSRTKIGIQKLIF